MSSYRVYLENQPAAGLKFVLKPVSPPPMKKSALPVNRTAIYSRNITASRMCVLIASVFSLTGYTSAQVSPASPPSASPQTDQVTKTPNLIEPATQAASDMGILRPNPSLREGRSTQLWKLMEEDRLAVSVAGASRKATDYLEFWLYLPERVPSGHIGFQLGKKKGALPLAWVGWRRVSIPIAVMKKAESTDESEKLILTREGDFPANFAVYFQDVRRTEISTGAGITEEDLLDHVDLTRPGLEAVRAAVEQNQKGKALAALAAHFRQDFTARMPWPDNLDSGNSELTEEERNKALSYGEKLLAGIVSHADHTYTYPNGNIDWRLNPTKGKENQTFEWGFSLNRHGMWESLAKAYRLTGDEKYAALWALQFRRWVEQMPAPGINEERGDSGWRGLEAGLRFSRIWPSAFFSLAPAKSVTDADILLFLRSTVDHGNFLSGHPYSHGNHFLLAMCGLYTQGVVLPELKDSAFWRKHAVAQLGLSLQRNTVPDGAWNEMAPGYHQWVVSRTRSAFRLAQINGFSSEVPADLLTQLQKMAEWNVLLSGPDGMVPTLNDGGKVKVSQSVAPSVTVFPNSALLRWAAQREDAASAPPTIPASYALPDSGYTLLRTGWGAKDSYVLFDVGPLGGWHGHHDALNVVTYFHGRPFLFDNGGWAYDASIWRQYGPSTASHNTIMIDGLGQWRVYSRDNPIGPNPASTPKPAFATSPQIDYASGWYTAGYGTKKDIKSIAHHRRELAFLKGPTPVLLVVDTMAPHDAKKHRYEARWHLLSTNWKSDKKSKVVWTTDEGKPNLAVLSLTGAEEFHADSAVKTPEVLGWSFDGQTGGPYPALTLRQAVTAAGVQRLITVFIPMEGTPDNPVVSVTHAAANTWTVTIKGQVPITLELAPNAADNQPSFSLSGIPWPQLQ